MNDWKPVPKVYASTAGALVSSIVIAALVRYGWTNEQAAMIAPDIAAFAIAVAPPLVTLLFGYVTPDNERETLKQIRASAEDGDDAARKVMEYLATVR